MDEKDKLIAAQAEDNRILKDLVVVLTAKVAELTAQLNKNSNNSGKPPSSDGLRKGAPKNSRTPSEKKSGGQKGHNGVTKELSPAPDTIVELKPQADCDCGGTIILETDTVTVRQVADIQLAQLITIEYRAFSGACDLCGKTYKASFPDTVNSTVSYGENIQAIVTYLNTYQLIPIKRTAELVSDLFGISMSQGSIVNATNEAYENLAETEARIKNDVIGSDVVHFDESGMRVMGKTQWLHSAGTEKSTVYAIHPKRGKVAMDEMGMLPNFTGTAVHDHWKSYYSYDKCAHAECNQHHLRTLKYLYEDLGMAWARDMACLLLRIHKHIYMSKLFGAQQLEQADIDAYTNIYRSVLQAANQQEDAPKESNRMSKRLLKYEHETLLFMLDFGVPFTNNLAERDIRMPKAKQKTSGSFRSVGGANAFARIRGFVSTVKKRGKNVFDGMTSVFSGKSKDFLFPTDV